MKKYVIKLNDKVYEVEIEEVTAENAATLAEAVKSSGASTAQASRGASQVSGGQKIEAPMPGSIVKVAVKPGDIVKNGQLLLVLEAMKMENEIVSPVDGTVNLVAVDTGQSVNSGELLIQIG
ncbi:biotin/lipoyl-containing protein [Clostridium peptidivorans]|uniref:biotin/lipoyl-containing protein n=1 Tax=Clostridium peptidivorans TaxID=100174 RepID=UPI000BE2BA9E|nr:biotin/lipoyl-containing protein [Clostridium peptidivorans]